MSFQPSEKATQAVTSFVTKSVAADKSKVSAVDILRAEGVTSDMLDAPGKGEDRSFYDGWLKPAIVAAFTDKVRALLDADTKSLRENEKADKRYWQQQIGSKIKDLRAAIVKRERAEDSTPNKKTTKGDRLRQKIQDVIDAIQKAEDGIVDPARAVASLKVALTAI